MLHHYALEPGLLHDFDKVRYFVEKFGVAEGRLISRFPKKWEGLVREASRECGDVQRKRIEEFLLRNRHRLVPSHRAYNERIEWLPNAETAHAIKPFYRIIAVNNPRRRNYVLLGDELDDGMEGWTVCRGISVNRNAHELAKAVAPLLSISQEVLFVDPYFQPGDPRFMKSFEAFIRVLKGNAQTITRIEYHMYAEKFENTSAFIDECRRSVPAMLPVDFRVTFVRWNEKLGGERFHDRYVLTNMGGLVLPGGLNTGSGTTDVILLDAQIYQKRWLNFQRATSAFDLESEVTIVGTTG